MFYIEILSTMDLVFVILLIFIISPAFNHQKLSFIYLLLCFDSSPLHY